MMKIAKMCKELLHSRHIGVEAVIWVTADNYGRCSTPAPPPQEIAAVAAPASATRNAARTTLASPRSKNPSSGARTRLCASMETERMMSMTELILFAISTLGAWQQICRSKVNRCVLAGFLVLLSTFQAARAQTLDSFNPSANGAVYALVVQADGRILVGGSFTSIGGQPRNYIARLNADGSLDGSFDPNSGGPISCIAVHQDGSIFVGGNFSSIGGQDRQNLVRLNPDGSLDTGFGSTPNDEVTSLVMQPDGKILVGGYFSNIGGWPRNRLARLNSDGRLDAGFNPNSSSGVQSLGLQADGKVLVGGFFTMIGGQTRNRIARLNSDGSLDAGFNPDANGQVWSVALQPDGKILISGIFSTIGGQENRNFSRLNSDGSVDLSFNSSINILVKSLTVQADGKIIGVGNFNHLGQSIARFNADGSLDVGFNPAAIVSAESLVVQPDGKIIVGGTFTSIGGQTRNRIARLNNNSAATSTISVNGPNEVTWSRGGTAPQVSQVTFDRWDGGTWLHLGTAVSVPGGWTLTGLSLPSSGQIRARGRTTGGFSNGSSSLIEQTTNYAFQDLSGRDLFDAAVLSVGLSGTAAQPGGAPFGDGVPNLLKYAFNMNLSGPDCRSLVPETGISGLPVPQIVSGKLRYEFLRRKNSGLTYVPQQSSNLTNDLWQAATGAVTVASIDQTWERVTIEQPLGEARFLRVEVAFE